MTGWVLFLDYLIVMALSALFLPHYLAGAFQIERARPQARGTTSSPSARSPRSASSGSSGARPLHDRDPRRRPRRARHSSLLLGFGLALLFDAGRAHARTRPRHEPDWTRSRSRFRSRCSRTRASRRSPTWPRRRGGPGSTCRAACSPRSPSSWRLRGDRLCRLSAFPVENGQTAARHDLAERAVDRHRRGARTAHLAVGARRRASALRRHLRCADPAREHRDCGLRLRPTRVLARRARDAAARVRSARPTHPHRAAVDPRAVAISIALLVVVDAAAGNPVIFLASLFSFGVLLAFAAAQLAVPPAAGHFARSSAARTACRST